MCLGVTWFCMTWLSQQPHPEVPAKAGLEGRPGRRMPGKTDTREDGRRRSTAPPGRPVPPRAHRRSAGSALAMPVKGSFTFTVLPFASMKVAVASRAPESSLPKASSKGPTASQPR